MVAGQVTVEDGEGIDVTETGRVAVVAQFSVGPAMSRSLAVLVAELAANGYRSVVSSTCESPESLRWPTPLPPGTVVLRRPNLGYDFGSWAVALDRFRSIATLDRVILTNDSMVGPFAPLSPLIADYDSARTDVWSLTDSYQLGRHMQSFFVGFRGGVLAQPGLRQFFRDIRVEPTKMDVVRRYEVGLTATCLRHGYTMSTRFRSQDLRLGLENPTLAGWNRLIEAGFPFVKRTMINDPSTAPGSEHVAAVVRRAFGVELADWL